MTAKILYILIMASFCSVYSIAQVIDNFGDGDFTADPKWQGDTSNFIVALQELQLMASGAGTSYLSTSSSHIINSTWSFKVELQFNPSSANYARVYLVSDTSNLSGEVSGYFVMIGGTPDEVSLYRQDALTTTKIIDGADGTLNTSSVEVEIKVTRDESGNWSLYSDPTSTGSYNLEGSATDVTHNTSNFFGVLCQYTSTRSEKFIFDDFSITSVAVPDTSAPRLDSAIIASSDTVELYFNERIGAQTFDPLNFSIEGVQPNSVISMDLDSMELQLIFQNLFNNGHEYHLSLDNIADSLGNTTGLIEIDVHYFQPFPVMYRDVVINEIMADPNPPEDLPSSEYVEIFNSSSNPIQLEGWRFSDANTDTDLVQFILLPDSFLILTADTSLFSSFGTAMELNPWPILNNSGDNLKLSSPTEAVDSVAYDLSWYQDNEKDNGGWSLEQISDILNCLGSNNWAASLNSQGGTPGMVNSNYPTEVLIPQLNEIAIFSPDSILLEFSHAMDWGLPYQVNIDGYSHSLGKTNQLMLIMNPPLLSDTIYKLELSGFANCGGYPMPNFVGNIFMDNSPPVLEKFEFIYRNEITLSFSDTLAIVNLGVDNFQLNGTSSANITIEGASVVHLEFDSLENGIGYDLEFNVSDNSGNALMGALNFIYKAPYSPIYGDIVLTEFLPDPVPALGLPEEEFIEIFNRSDFRIPLSEFTINDLASSGTFPRTFIEPNELLILCKSSKTQMFENFGRVIGISNWPSINSASETIELKFRDKVIHGVEYEISWYDDQEKKDGGWSLEIIDPSDYCGGKDNWRGSVNEMGGTPGSVNSVNADKPDLLPPQLLRAVAIDSATIQIEFDEQIYSSNLSLDQFTISPATIINGFEAMHNQVKLTVFPLETNLEYRLEASDISDCYGNSSPSLTADLIVPDRAKVGDVFLNEILFNPRTDGSDYLEIYNPTSRYFDLKDWSVTNSQGIISVVANNAILKPGQYLVLTPDPTNIMANYLTAIDSNILLFDLPPMPN